MEDRQEPRDLPWLAKKAMKVVPAKRRDEFEYELRWYYERQCCQTTTGIGRLVWIHCQIIRAFWYEVPQYARTIAKLLAWMVFRWISR